MHVIGIFNVLFYLLYVIYIGYSILHISHSVRFTLRQRRCIPLFPGTLDPVQELPLRQPMQVIIPVPPEEPSLELLRISANCLHLHMNARLNHTREFRQPSIHWDVPHYYFRPVGLKLARYAFPTKSAYYADDQVNGPIKGSRSLASAHQAVYPRHHGLSEFRSPHLQDSFAASSRQVHQDVADIRADVLNLGGTAEVLE